MKTCSICKVSKSLSEFSFKNKEKKTYTSCCRTCFYEKYDKPRYVKDKDLIRARNDARRKLVRKQYFDYIQTLSCEECGFDNWMCLEFNHKDQTTKDRNVSDMVKSHSFESIKKEIDKCTVLCANCHRKHTAEQLGWYKDLI